MAVDLTVDLDKYTDDPTIRELLELLFDAGEHLTPELQKTLLDADAALDDALRAILNDPQSAYVGAPGQGWAPLHAATLLAARRAKDDNDPRLAS